MTVDADDLFWVCFCGVIVVWGFCVMVGSVDAFDFQPVIVTSNHTFYNSTLHFFDDTGSEVVVESFTGVTPTKSRVYYVFNFTKPYYYNRLYNVSVQLDGVWRDIDNNTPSFLGRGKVNTSDIADLVLPNVSGYAKYQFDNNNFNGSNGNFTTNGTIEDYKSENVWVATDQITSSKRAIYSGNIGISPAGGEFNINNFWGQSHNLVWSWVTINNKSMFMYFLPDANFSRFSYLSSWTTAQAGLRGLVFGGSASDNRIIPQYDNYALIGDNLHNWNTGYFYNLKAKTRVDTPLVNTTEVYTHNITTDTALVLNGLKIELKKSTYVTGDVNVSNRIFENGTRVLTVETGDISSVVAGNGLTGGGTTGAVTLSVGSVTSANLSTTVPFTKLPFGTLTDKKYCTYDSGQQIINCTMAGGGVYAIEPTIHGENVTAGTIANARLPQNVRVTGSIQAGTLNGTTKTNTPIVGGYSTLFLTPVNLNGRYEINVSVNSTFRIIGGGGTQGASLQLLAGASKTPQIDLREGGVRLGWMGAGGGYSWYLQNKSAFQWGFIANTGTLSVSAHKVENIASVGWAVDTIWADDFTNVASQDADLIEEWVNKKDKEGKAINKKGKIDKRATIESAYNKIKGHKSEDPTFINEMYPIAGFVCEPSMLASAFTKYKEVATPQECEYGVRGNYIHTGAWSGIEKVIIEIQDNRITALEDLLIEKGFITQEQLKEKYKDSGEELVEKK